MNPILKLLAGLAVVAALALAALFADGLPGSAQSAQEKLRARIDESLAGPDSSWAQFRIDGQILIVTGNAPSRDARDALLARIDAEDIAGGYAFGAVTVVDASGLTVAAPVTPVADPFIWGVDRSAGGVVFSGYVPSQDARDALYILAAMLFPDDEITGSMEIASGAPASESAWSEAATAGVRALAYLERGEVSAVGPRLSLTGEAADATRARAARMLMESLPDGFAGEASVDAPDPDPVTEPIPAPEPEAEAAVPEDEVSPAEIAEIAEAARNDLCLEELSAAVDARLIGFSSARAEIDEASREQLSEIAGVLTRCPTIRIAVTGHTDSSGSAARNRQLSAYRADAVRAYLVSLGVDAERVTARGAGSSEPLASNATAAGRERNRRIEIDIVSGE